MTRPDALAKWLAFVGGEHCTCDYDWRSLGSLYGISMGKGWVRTTTAADCPEHTDQGRTRR